MAENIFKTSPHLGISISKIFLPFLQQERAFQKQPTVFQNQKRLPGVKKATLKRYTRTVGLGFKMPAEVRCRVELISSRIIFRFFELFFVFFNHFINHHLIIIHTPERESSSWKIILTLLHFIRHDFSSYF